MTSKLNIVGTILFISLQMSRLDMVCFILNLIVTLLVNHTVGSSRLRKHINWCMI